MKNHRIILIGDPDHKVKQAETLRKLSTRPAWKLADCEHPTITVFRTFRKGGETIALFPEIPGDMRGNCGSYMHMGQHGAAYPGATPYTRPATAEEIAPLAKELERTGYRLAIRHRITPAMHAKRRDALAVPLKS